MEQKKNVGPIIGQAINILLQHDPAFRTAFMGRGMGNTITCEQHKESGRVSLENTEYALECAGCNTEVMMAQKKVEQMTKRILHFDIAIHNTLHFKESQKQQATPVTKKLLSSEEFLARCRQGSYLKLYANKECVIKEGEEGVLWCAGKPYQEQAGQFMAYYVPVWFSAPITGEEEWLHLQIPQTSYSFLNQSTQLNTGVKIMVSGKIIDGQFGKKNVAQWKVVSA